MNYSQFQGNYYKKILKEKNADWNSSLQLLDGTNNSCLNLS